MPDAEHALIPLAARLLIAVLLLAIYRRRREAYLLYWTVAWVLLLIRYAAHQMWLGLGGSQSAPPGFELLLLGFAALLFLDSGRAFTRRAASPTATAFLAPVLVVWWALGLTFQPVALYVPLELGLAGVVLLTARFFWRESRRREIFGGALMALALAAWGVTFLGGLLRAWMPVELVPVVESIAAVAPQLVGISLLVVLYEDEKRLLERHMLGLAGLNLVTSSAQHAATVQDMLGMTLERVLGVLRMPAGAMVLALEGQTDQFHIIHRGNEDFLRTVEHEGLFPYLRGLGRRLGGLVVLPDLDRPARPPIFAHEEEFKKLRALARTAETRLLVVVSLRTKAGEAGLLLLTARESRRLNPAELRLLMGLGGQVGMAVENYRLMRQSTRRYGELRVLNEIGRALSSTRSVDDLLERIHTEMGRVLDVSNFYIALLDRRKDEVTFELEVKDGAFLPKRSRRTRNGLTEFILRRKEPVLVRGNFQQTMAALGVEPGRLARSYCAVPILLHGEGVGVIGLVSYTDDNAFDEEHVGVLTILAAQAAVAIENAHLFAQEHQRSQQLSLLNNVSRKAISTLNPEEMLTAIASELHAGLPYDHLGLGVLDYNAREVVIQAEGGRSAHGLNRRFKLGDGVIGQVAVTGMVREQENLDDAARLKCKTVLADARSLVALPIVYADQLLGVLNVESRRAQSFSPEDVLLLRTLADQIASALHNAFVFQSAQEQAITDGLTGVKTHRFFMEGLQSEWRRATRVNRTFSLLMLDLDKFKFVNDYFGHLEGDTVLQRVGRILEQSVRRSDMVARYGGDEFVVLMPETKVRQAQVLGEKLRDWLSKDPLLREKKITPSIGVATYPQHASTPQELIQVADASMYLAKHRGGNVVVSADQYKVSEQKQWQRNVLEAYLGVTIKRLFSTGPEAFDEVYHRLEEVIASLGKRGGEELPPAVLETVTSLAFAIDAKDHYTQGHSQNVARYCLQVARHLSLTEREAEELRLGAILHDVGKIGVPERILNKPTQLEGDEFEIMKEHAILGAKILEPIRAIQNIQRIVRHHHERWDGGGYPDGLADESIPLASRIIALADAYDTMVTERTYKRSRSHLEALEELRRCAGSQFDPRLVETFVEAMSVEIGATGS